MGTDDSFDDKEDVLQLETRKEIFEYVQSNPGVHFSQLKRDLNMETGLVQHHLNTLEDYDVLASEYHQSKRRLFVAEELAEEERAILSSLRYETTRHILLFLMRETRARNRAIAEEVGVSPATVSWHVSRLIENGIVSEIEDGRTTYYTVADEDLTMQLLMRYKESFVDKAVDNVLDFWG